MSSQLEAYDNLRCYTLAHRATSFIHQHVVDAFTAQHANEQTPAIALTFALVGLYLFVERGFSGRAIQRLHTGLARRHRQPWPAWALPARRGFITTIDVVASPAGFERDKAIQEWCASVWEAFHASREPVIQLLRES